MIQQSPAAFAYLVRKKTKKVPILEEKAEQSFLNLVKGGSSNSSIRSALSGLIEYYYNTNNGKMPPWLTDILSSSQITSVYVIPSRRALLESIEAYAFEIAGMDESDIEAKIDRYLQARDLKNLLILLKQLEEGPENSIREILLKKAIFTKLYSKFSRCLSDEVFVGRKSFFNRDTSMKDVHTFYYKNYEGKELIFENVKIWKKNKHRLTVKSPMKSNLISLYLDKIDFTKTKTLPKDFSSQASTIGKLGSLVREKSETIRKTQSWSPLIEILQEMLNSTERENTPEERS